MTDGTTTITTVEHPSPPTELNIVELEAEQRENILYQLETYPYVSRSMLQTALGPALPPKLWGPVLEKMIEEGLLVVETINTTTPKGINRSKNVIHHKDMPFPPTK